MGKESYPKYSLRGGSHWCAWGWAINKIVKIQCNLFKKAECVDYREKDFHWKLCHKNFDALRSRTCSHLWSLSFPKGFCVANVLPGDWDWFFSSWFIKLKQLSVWWKMWILVTYQWSYLFDWFGWKGDEVGRRESRCKNDPSLKENVEMLGTDDAGHSIDAELHMCRIEGSFFQGWLSPGVLAVTPGAENDGGWLKEERDGEGYVSLGSLGRTRFQVKGSWNGTCLW